ncbi:MAG: hypothetical protein AAF732_14640 [Pseudomonadota bacterium]
MKTVVVIAALVMAVGGPAYGQNTKRGLMQPPSCSKYKRLCRNTCEGRRLAQHCQDVICEPAFRKCMRTGIWHTKGYVYRKGMRRL